MDRNPPLRTGAAVRPTTEQIDSKNIGAPKTRTTTTCNTSVKVTVRKWSRKMDGTFGCTMVSFTLPRKRTNLASGLGEKFLFWKEKESSVSNCSWKGQIGF